MHIYLLCVGRLKESFYQQAANEYLKRLGGLCTPVVRELSEYKLPAKPRPADIEIALSIEATQIQETLQNAYPPRTYTIAMCVEGKEISSEDLSDKLLSIPQKGYTDICFILGSSYGLSPDIKAKAQERLSLSRMTFPHHLARVMLLEQIYRALSIAQGSRYHK